MTANAFGIYQPTVFDLIFVYMLGSEEEMKLKLTSLEVKYGMPQAFGLVDGTQMPIFGQQSFLKIILTINTFYSLSVEAI